MSRRGGVLVLSAIGLAAALAGGCRGPAGRLQASVASSFESIRSTVADMSSPGGRVWFVERTQSLGSYAVELSDLFPLQFGPRRTLRFFVLRGRVRVRVGAQERELGPGAFAAVPPRLAHRILPFDKEPARLLLLFMPDGQDAAVIEMPGVRRRLQAGDRS